MKKTTLNENEKRTVLAVFGELVCRPTSELNTWLGSITIEEMAQLYHRLKYEDFCKEHGIKSVSDMDEYDYETYAEEQEARRCADYDED